MTVQSIRNISDHLVVAANEQINWDQFSGQFDAITMDLANLPEDSAARTALLTRVGNQIQTLKDQSSQMKAYAAISAQALNILTQRLNTVMPVLDQLDRSLQRSEARYIDKSTSCGQKALKTLRNFSYQAAVGLYNFGSKVVSFVTHPHQA